jgi:TatA/E family protein of Tat protein translocase
MFGLGVPELILIFAVALIVFGPRRLPEIGKTLGKAMKEFKKATDDLKNTIERETQIEEIKQIKSSLTEPLESVRSSLTAPFDASAATVSRAEPSPPLMVPQSARPPAPDASGAPHNDSGATPAAPQTAGGAPGADHENRTA